MSKGSARRPCFVSEEEVEKNWPRKQPTSKPADPERVKKILKEQFVRLDNVFKRLS